MEPSEKRARPNAKPPALNENTERLKRLLEIEERRLDVAVKIENDRGIVFPETTVIIRDIKKLAKEIEDRETYKDEGLNTDPLDTLFESID